MSAPYLERTRQELGAFVRQRRGQLRPESFGIEVTPNRRTKGLRREEVAAIAGVGLTWYTWFEQGRDINVSPAFLDSVARGLRLNPSERAYLYFLAERPISRPAPEVEASTIRPSLMQLADALGPRPAYVKNVCWDLLYWNQAATFVFGDFAELPPEDRNIAWLAFSHGPMRHTMADWEGDARRLVARLRADYARSAREPRFQALIDRLLSSSEEFREIWEAQAVLETGAGTRRIKVEGIGVIDFDYTVCKIGESDETKLVVYAIPPEATSLAPFEARFHDWRRARDAGGASADPA